MSIDPSVSPPSSLAQGVHAAWITHEALKPGMELDGFIIGPCIHSGAMARIHSVQRAQPDAEHPFALVMKVPRMRSGDGGENIIGFEVEHQMLQTLHGPHVPRFVAAGDLDRLPYLVMEHIPGQSLSAWLPPTQRQPNHPQQVAQLGAAVAKALHALHQQNACHLDLKPDNIMIRPDGTAVLLDFGLSCHAHYPDLLAEASRKAIGSPAWMAPEQVVGVRGDPRSDVFALGVILYELTTGELPFGAPTTVGGLRQRLWMDPKPPKAWRSDVPDWLQEIILKCLEPEANERYPSAAHLALDLSHPEQVKLTDRAHRTQGTGFWVHFKRWIKAAGKHYQPSPPPQEQIDQVPIIMVAVPHVDVSDATLYSLRQAVSRSMGVRPGARLACVTVNTSTSTGHETQQHRQLLTHMQQWAQGLDVSQHTVSFHVLDATDVAQALIRYAEHNAVSLMVLGAATHGLQLQRFMATVPIKVAMHAPCTVILVKQQLPFEQLQHHEQEAPSPSIGIPYQ